MFVELNTQKYQPEPISERKLIKYNIRNTIKLIKRTFIIRHYNYAKYSKINNVMFLKRNLA